MEQDLVSVYVSVYNTAEYLQEAIESILNQTYQNLELILVNDGSRDNSIDILHAYQSKDNRVKVIHNEKNIGVSQTANQALTAANGKFVARFDSDDIALPHRIATQVEYLKKHPNVTMISSDAIIIDSQGNKLGIKRFPGFENPLYTNECLQKGQMAACEHTGFMTYKEKILEVGGYREEISCVVDYDLYNRMIEKGNILIILREPLVKYRWHNTSIMAVTAQNFIIQKTNDFVVENARRRRSGQPEIGFQDFLKMLDGQPWWKKIDRKRKYWFFFYYKRVQTFLSTKQYFPFIINMGIAFCLRPIVILKRIKGQLIR